MDVLDLRGLDDQLGWLAEHHRSRAVARAVADLTSG